MKCNQNDGFKILHKKVITKKKHPPESQKMTKPFWGFNVFLKVYGDFTPHRQITELLWVSVFHLENEEMV